MQSLKEFRHEFGFDSADKQTGCYIYKDYPPERLKEVGTKKNNWWE